MEERPQRSMVSMVFWSERALVTSATLALCCSEYCGLVGVVLLFGPVFEPVVLRLALLLLFVEELLPPAVWVLLDIFV